MTVNYREAWNIHACSGILFNHESPLRGIEFVTRKISLGVAEIAKGKKEVISLGNLNAERDWGHARDYVEATWKILQQNIPDDFVISTGKKASVRTFIELTCEELGWNGIRWEGEGLNEIGIRKSDGKNIIKVDKRYFRPTEVDTI